MLETRRRLFFLAITLVLVVQILQFMPWVLAAPPTPPVAIFTYTPTAPLVNETVTFDGSNSNGTIVTYQWTFDTLGWGSNAICTFVFTQPGTYNVILKVIDENELLNTTSKNITVYAPPVAVFTYSVSEPLVNETVTFNASESYDFDGSIVSYSWDFGDETNGTGVTVNHTYLVEGNYTVVLNVNDNDGFTNSTFKSIIITTRYPFVSFIYSPTLLIVNQTVTFDASFSEPRGGTVDSYAWNFGDGTIITEDSSTTTHAYITTGTFTVTLNVTDSEGLWNTISKNLTLTSFPVASFTYSPIAAIVNEEITFNASLSTPDGGTIVNYFWEFGDGTNITENDPIAYHTYTTAGIFFTLLNVTDSEGLWDLVSKSIEVHAHDVAVIQVTPSATIVYVGQVVNVTVVVRNEGTTNETFEVALYWNETLIGTQTVVDLTPDTEKILKFNWNTTGALPDVNYAIKAEVSVVPGETVTTNNIHINGVVKVRSQTTPQPFGLNAMLPYVLIICLGSGGSIVSAFLWKNKRAKKGTALSAETPPAQKPSCPEDEVKEYRDYILLLLNYQKLQERYRHGQISREVYLKLKAEYEKELAEKGEE